MQEKMNIREMENIRKIRAYAILSKGDTPKKVNEETFILPSQSNPDRKYKITHKQEWTCNCPDFQKRHVKYKHIQAVEMWVNLRNTIMNEDTLDLKEQMENVIKCEACGSLEVVKDGVRKNDHREIQRYKCKDCGHRFTVDKVKGYKVNAKLIALTMDLYFKGLSTRKIADTIYQFYEIKLHHETIRRWINTFMGKIREHTDKLEPNVGDIWHIDEQKIKANGEWFYSWNILDENTRFLIANTITKQRSILETEMVMKKAKKNIQNANPEVIITDGMPAYHSAIRNEFGDSVTHIGGVGIRDRINNNVLERYHGTYRERDKVMRGLENDSTGKQMNDNMRTYYNFIREHSVIGRTPAEQAGINLGLGKNRMYGLLSMAITPECDTHTLSP